MKLTEFKDNIWMHVLGETDIPKYNLYFLTVIFVFFSVFKSVIKYSCNKENIFCSFNQKILPPSLEQLCKEAMLNFSLKSFKGRGWSKIAIMHISVNNQWIFTKFSAAVHYVISY